MRRKLAVVGVCLLFVACSRDQWQRFPGPDDVVALVPWFANMYTGPAIQPYEMLLMPVEGTVPVTGAQRPLPPIPANIPTLNRMPNPVQRTAESIDRGRDRYEIYCSVCHGDQGAGDGPVAPALLGIVPSLVTERARGYSDGYIYSLVRYGRGVMRLYGDKVRGDDQWHIVNYVRVLQGTAR